MKHFIILMILTLLVSCDYKQLWEEDQYEVHWLDGQISLVRKLNQSGDFNRRVGPGIIALGSNVQYIVVKRKWNNGKVTSYYFLNKLKDGDYENSEDVTQGPFTEAEFKVMKRKYDLPEFTETF